MGFAPWFLTFACTAMLIVIGYFLVENIQWYKASVFSSSIVDVNQPRYRLHAYHLHLGVLKRSVGLFTGFAIMFLGLGVAFFTLRNNSTLDASTGGLSVKLVTASPGLMALIVGAFIITSTINSKDSYPEYNSETPRGQSIDEPLDKGKKPSLPFE